MPDTGFQLAVRVGFTGTRSGPTPAQHRSMDRLLLRLPIARLVHGGCVGCDTFAHHTVSANGLNRNTVIEIHPALGMPKSTVVTIPMGNCEIYPELPPLERDRIIVRRIHGLIAVPRSDKEDASGTWSTVRYARELGCPVYVVRQDGRVIRDEDPIFAI